MTGPPSQKALKALDAIVDKVLAYKPKPKTKAAKKRKKRAAKIAKEMPRSGDLGYLLRFLRLIRSAKAASPPMNSKSSQGGAMEDAGLATATYWAPLLETI